MALCMLQQQIELASMACRLETLSVFNFVLLVAAVCLRPGMSSLKFIYSFLPFFYVQKKILSPSSGEYICSENYTFVIFLIKRRIVMVNNSSESDHGFERRKKWKKKKVDRLG